CANASTLKAGGLRACSFIALAILSESQRRHARPHRGIEELDDEERGFTVLKASALKWARLPRRPILAILLWEVCYSTEGSARTGASATSPQADCAIYSSRP